MTSNSISSQIQTQYHLSSNPCKKSLSPSPSHHIFFNSGNNHLKNPIFLTGANPKPIPNATASGIYMPSPEETLYDLLGISESGTLSDIKRAYKQMALKYHPDVSPPGRVDEYTMRFIKVQEAYETLSDPESRATYDICIANGLPLSFSGTRDPSGKTRWKESWVMQVAELKRRKTVDQCGRMSWAARMRKQRSEAYVNGSDLDQ